MPSGMLPGGSLLVISQWKQASGSTRTDCLFQLTWDTAVFPLTSWRRCAPEWMKTKKPWLPVFLVVWWKDMRDDCWAGRPPQLTGHFQTAHMQRTIDFGHIFCYISHSNSFSAGKKSVSFCLNVFVSVYKRLVRLVSIVCEVLVVCCGRWLYGHLFKLLIR